ncbi:hypothetical protein TELCIR_00348 [Teladorsagia circumcincta]|uniref:Uncharacterized protein n=1 Tax=Teladorsagia circumcincta TaxID=45464 RepID=A0A2G9V4U4_TELCI|nr:hypothetical protein TELCIR_00348 [Teladorsagia circumcincta]
MAVPTKSCLPPFISNWNYAKVFPYGSIADVVQSRDTSSPAQHFRLHYTEAGIHLEHSWKAPRVPKLIQEPILGRELIISADPFQLKDLLNFIGCRTTDIQFTIRCEFPSARADFMSDGELFANARTTLS